MVCASFSRVVGLSAISAVPQFVAVAVAKLFMLFVTAGALCWLTEYLPGVRKNTNSSSASSSSPRKMDGAEQPLTRPLERLPSQHVAPYAGPLEWDDSAASAADTLERSGVFHQTLANSFVDNCYETKNGSMKGLDESEAREGTMDSASYGEPTPEKYCAIIVAGLNAECEDLT